MEDDSMLFDEDRTVVNFARELEFDEPGDGDASVEMELLYARVKAARYAGA